MNVQCMSNLRQIGLLAKGYEAENKRLPAHYDEIVRAIPPAPTPANGWPNQLDRLHYLPDKMTYDTRLVWGKYSKARAFLSCPFLPDLELTTNRYPSGQHVLYAAYNLYNAYFANDTDSASPVSDNKPRWTQSSRPYRLDGKKVGVLASDLNMIVGPTQYRVSHPMPGVGARLRDDPAGSFIANYAENHASTPITSDPRGKVTSNYLLRDGSVQSLQLGPNDRRVDFPIKVFTAGGIYAKQLLPLE